jgi:RiboL-PSP-HEPN
MDSDSDIQSPAFKGFQENLEEIKTIMSLFEIDTGDLRKRLVNESLCRAALVLLCSHVENFFETLITDILVFHELNETPISKLPEKLKVSQVLKVSDSLNSSYPGDKWKLIQIVRSNKFADDAEKCNLGDFDQDIQIKGFASPGSKEVELLFSNVGINKVWEIIEKKSSSSRLKLALNGFVNRRHNIAHGNAGDKPTPDDIKSTIVDMDNLLKIFNLIVVEYLLENFEPHHIWGYKVSEEIN